MSEAAFCGYLSIMMERHRSHSLMAIPYGFLGRSDLVLAIMVWCAVLCW